jgi:proline iminopeptidase
MKAKIRDIELYFDVLGSHIEFTDKGVVEKPIMFCLHGGPGGDHSVFKKYIPALQDIAQLIMMDHRGCGMSERTQQSDYTLENNVEDVEALRQYLGVEKIIVYGHSYGGMLAQAYALRYPDNISKLILGVTTGHGRFYDVARERLKKRGGKKEIAWGEKLFAGDFKSDIEFKKFFVEMAPMYSNKVLKENIKIKIFDDIKVSHEAINEGFGGFMRDIDFIPELHKIACPTLVFAGRDDWVCAPQFSEEIAVEIPNAKLVIFEHSGHSVPMDEPEAFINMMRDFIKSKQDEN